MTSATFHEFEWLSVKYDLPGEKNSLIHSFFKLQIYRVSFSRYEGMELKDLPKTSKKIVAYCSYKTELTRQSNL